MWLWLVAKWPFATRRNRLLLLVGSFTILIITAHSCSCEIRQDAHPSKGNSAAAHLSGRCAPRLVCSYCSRKGTLCTRHKTTKNPCLRFGRMTERCKQKRPRREPWAQSAEKESHESDFTGSGVLLGSHLPGAESTGVAAVAAAGLNAGEV